jgi:hypothetical protein
MYGPDALEPIPADDPLITGRLAVGGLEPGNSVTSPLGSDLTHPRMRRSRGLRFITGTSSPSTGQAVSKSKAGGPPAGLPRPQVPLLMGVRMPDAYGDVRGRWAVIYSPLDIHCGCDGHFCIDCNGYEPGDARAIAGNILLSVHLDRAAGDGSRR